MKYGLEKFFAPNYNVNRMQNEVLPNPNSKYLCEAFKERVIEYYLQPAKNLQAFAQGVLCFCLIDFLANIVITEVNQVKNYREFFKNTFNKNSYRDPKKIYVGERIVTFIVKVIKVFNYEDGYSFYKYVRNGLIHEGRVKCGCYLNNKIENAIEKKEGVLEFNPNIVLLKLESWLKDYFENIKKGREDYEKLRDYIEKILDEDLEAIEKRDKNNKFPCKK